MEIGEENGFGSSPRSTKGKMEPRQREPERYMDFSLLENCTIPVSSLPALVQDVYEVVDHIRREMSERTTEMKEAIHRGTGKLYHVVTSNNWIVQFRIGVDGNLIFERTVKSINVQTQKLKKARQKILDAGKRVPIRYGIMPDFH